MKLVALTLIRAGVQIRAIRPLHDFLTIKRDLPLIQVAADSSTIDDPALAAQAIGARCAFRASKLLSEKILL
jgi:hypothetical protein